MKKYYVTFRIAGSATAVVEAENESEAIAKARDFDIVPGSVQDGAWGIESFDSLIGEVENG